VPEAEMRYRLYSKPAHLLIFGSPVETGERSKHEDTMWREDLAFLVLSTDECMSSLSLSAIRGFIAG
jgi:hypothetical protein